MDCQKKISKTCPSPRVSLTSNVFLVSDLLCQVCSLNALTSPGSRPQTPQHQINKQIQSTPSHHDRRCPPSRPPRQHPAVPPPPPPRATLPRPRRPRLWRLRRRDHSDAWRRAHRHCRTLPFHSPCPALLLSALGPPTCCILPPPPRTNTTQAIFNTLASTYHILSLSSPSFPIPKWLPIRMYSLRATLALDAFLACIWLGASGTLTSEVVIIHALTRRFGRRPYGESDAWVGVVGAGAGTGGVEVLVSLFFFSQGELGVAGLWLINGVFRLLHIISFAIHWRIYRQRAAGGGAPRGRGRRTLGEGVVVAGVGSMALGVAPFPPVVMGVEGDGEGEGEGDGERESDECGGEGKEDV